MRKLFKKTKTKVCKAGTACETPKTDKINLWTVTFLVIALFSVPYLTPNLHAQTPETTEENIKIVTLDVTGMTCSSCEFAFAKGTSLVPGVTDVQADFVTGQAVVSFDSSKIALDEVLAGTEKIGYKSTLKVIPISHEKE